MRRATAAVVGAIGAVAALTVAVSGSAGGATAGRAATVHPVMYVGNNWDGTADVIDATTYTRISRLNVIPDKDQRLKEIYANPVRLAYFLAIRQQIGEGHDQYVDDMFSTPDGRMVAVSRPSFADVVGIDLASRKIVWRFPMHGERADHMAISRDGTRILVSDSTANHVDEVDIRTGTWLRQFESGDSPHESNYSKDGTRIFHASIGRIYTPTDPSQFCPFRDPTKGDQRFEIVDNATFGIVKKWDIGVELEKAGFHCMSSAVRPMAISPDERTAYLQISFFHGYVVFDLANGTVTQVVNLPESAAAQAMPKSQYVLNSAHHGIAIDAAGTKLCVAGTMDDYVGLVPIADPAHPTILPLPHVGDRPYWATNGPASQQCWVSIAGNDRVNVYDYATNAQVASVPVGYHPQRIRAGSVASAVLAKWGVPN